MTKPLSQAERERLHTAERAICDALWESTEPVLSGIPTFKAAAIVAWFAAREVASLDAAEKERDETRLATVEAVLDLMQDAGTLEARADTIYPHANGYSCWFRDGGLGTAPLSAEEILARIDARALSRLGAGGAEG